MPNDQPVALKNLPEARTPPRLRQWWEWPCWAVFILGVGVVLLSMTRIGGPEWLSGLSWLRPALLVVLYAAFMLGAVNTFLAAKTFRRREKAIERWLRERLHLLEKEEGSTRHAEDDNGEAGKIQIWRHVDKDRFMPFHTIAVSGDYQPLPFRRVGKDFSTRYLLQDYLERIGAEVRSARRASASLAAALGGLFLTALQVYGRAFGP
jgi:hypothetical protein